MTVFSEPTLADVLETLATRQDLSPIRLRDLRSAVQRVAALIGQVPSGIPLDLPAISAKLAAVNPIAAGLMAKSFSNIRSDFLAAAKVSGLKSIEEKSRALSPAWAAVLAKLPEQRARIG